MVNNIIFEFVVCSVYFEWCDGMLIQIYVVNEIKPDIFIQTKVRLKKTYVLVWISSIWIHKIMCWNLVCHCKYNVLMLMPISRLKSSHE